MGDKMKYTNKNILPDTNPVLREKAIAYKFPLSDTEREELEGLLQYVKNSIDEELALKYDLSPAVGLAAPQVGISKRAFAIYVQDEEENYEFSQIFINPKLMAYSEETVFIDNGEACLSVPDEHKGIVPRPYYIKLKYFDLDGVEYIEEFEHFLSIAIQHEYDHLNGKLFYDHINPEFPFKAPNNSHPL